MRTASRFLSVMGVALLVVAGAGCGDDSPQASSSGAGTPSDPRVIDVEMYDIGYKPDSLEVKAGETVTFKFTNTGKIQHEAVFGDEAAQEAHDKEMAAGMDMSADSSGTDMGGMDMDGEHEAVVEPGETGEVTMTFDSPGSTIIGCHEPGHWDAGMRIDVTIDA